MTQQSRDRAILSGLVAVSKQFVDREEVLEATMTWLNSPDKESLVSTLVKRGSLSIEQQKTVESVVDSTSQQELCDSLNASLGDDFFSAMRNALQRIDAAPQADFQTRVPESSMEPGEQPLAVSEEDRFELGQELARGGLGEVFIAKDKQLNRNVALKQILNHWTDHPDYNARFLLEAEITGRLEHPGVVPVYALGRWDDNRYYYTMRLIRGVNLGDEIAEYFRNADNKDAAKQTLALRALLRRFVDVCNTIEYAHSKGVIHRDLKPANIMLGKYGETLVVDWGLAKQVDVAEEQLSDAESVLALKSGSGSTATEFGSVVGTPTHMSPEQASGRMHQVGPYSDIYGLGATLYHLLTGQPPHQCGSIEQLLKDIIHGIYPAPCEVQPSIPRPLEAICQKAMNLRDYERYKSARDMAADIDRWLADQQVLAYDEPLLSRAARALRQHQTVAVSSAVATILLCLAALLGTFFWQQVKTRQQAQARQIQVQQQQREREDLEQLAQKRSSVRTNLTSGLQEAGPGRFATALSFFRQGEQACANEPRLKSELAQLNQHSEQMSRLARSERLWKDAMDAMVFEQDQRALALMAADMQQLGVFEHVDWWDHLPVENLEPQVADRIEKRVHLELAMMVSLVGKNLLSAELVSSRALGLTPRIDAQQQRLLGVMQRVSRMAQFYRPTQWVARVEGLRRYFIGEIDSLPTIQWNPDNFVDAYMLGCMSLIAAQSGKAGYGSAIFAKFLNIEEPEQTARAYLRRATAIDPDNDIAHVMLGLAEHLSENFERAQSSYTTSQALRPDQSLAFALRGQSYYEQAAQNPGEEQRQRLLGLALQDVWARLELETQYESAYWLQGNVFRLLGQRSQAVSSFLAALDREPPVEMIRLNQWQFLLQGRDPNRVRRLSYVFEDRFEETIAIAKELIVESPTNPQFHLLQSAAELALGQGEAAADSAEQVLRLVIEQPSIPSTIPGHAQAILGEVARTNENWTEARQRFSESLLLDSKNVLALAGLASTLEQLVRESAATGSTDLALQKLALDTYQKLAECSFTNWQAVLAQQGLFRLHLVRRDHESANAALDMMLQLDRGLDLQKLSNVAESHGAESIAQRIDAMGIDSLFTDKSLENQTAGTLPLRNGNFELGLNKYWEPWVTTGECLAAVGTDKEIRPSSSGSRSLFVRHGSPQAAGSYAYLGQMLPAAPGNRYQILLWAKGEELSAGGIQIVLDEQWDQPILELPPGTYDWQSLAGEFTVAQTEANDALHRVIAIKIVSLAPGKAWLDDLRIERIDR